MAIFIDDGLKAEYFRQVTVLMGCARASNIVKAVNGWGERVSVEQGSSAFAFKGQPKFIDRTQRHPCHTVFWDPMRKDKVVIFERQRVFNPNKTPTKPIVTYKTVDYPAHISLAHEIGHAWQYRRNPTLYGNLALHGRVDDIEKENLDLNEYPVVDHFGLPRRLAYRHTAQHSLTARRQFQAAGWDVVFRKTFDKNLSTGKYTALARGFVFPTGPTF